MIYSNEFGTIDFWDDHPTIHEHKSIGLNLSGGTDSALLFWMLCREISIRKHDCIVQPQTLIDTERPTNIWNAKEIVLYMRDMFPDVEIKDIITGHFTKDSEGPGLEKSYWHNKFTQKNKDENKFTFLLHGKTANPPYEEALKHNLLKDRETVRDVESGNTHVKAVLDNYWCPFHDKDKRFLREIYLENSIMDLFEITASCISKNYLSNYFSKACRVCWWCREKKWSFGCYDYGEK